MSYLEKMTLKEALPILGKTYESLGLKSLILLQNQEWVNVITVIGFTHRNAEDLSKEYRLVEERLGPLDFENFKVILESRPINDIDNIIDEIETGYLTVEGIRTRLLCQNPEQIVVNRLRRSLHPLMRWGEHAEYESYSIFLGMEDTPENILSNSGISASMLGTKSLTDIARSWIGLEHLESSINIFFNLPIYATLVRINYKGGNEIAATLKVHEKIVDSCKAWLIRMGPYDIAPILEREEYNLATCDRTVQEGFAYITLEHDFNALDSNDDIQINLFHKDLGYLFTEESRLNDLVKPSEDSLIQSFNLFDAGKKVEENLLNPKDDKIFVMAVSWLLETINMRTLMLGRRFEIIRENGIEKGSADILACDSISKRLVVIDCTVSPPPANKIDKIRNTANYVSRKINNIAKPLIITPSDASAAKHAAKTYGVTILDKTDLEKMLDLFNKGAKYYTRCRSLIFQE